MIKAKITRDICIKGERVEKDTILNLSESEYKDLKLIRVVELVNEEKEELNKEVKSIDSKEDDLKNNREVDLNKKLKKKNFEL